MQFPTDYKQKTKSVSYQRAEDKVLKMENELMDHYGCNYSTLHKQLVRKEYHLVHMI